MIWWFSTEQMWTTVYKLTKLKFPQNPVYKSSQIPLSSTKILMEIKIIARTFEYLYHCYIQLFKFYTIIIILIIIIMIIIIENIYTIKKKTELYDQWYFLILHLKNKI